MFLKLFSMILALAVLLPADGPAARVFGQTQTGLPAGDVSKYIDPVGGLTADEAVRLALENNGELRALRSEIDAARGRLKQAGLRPNPKLNLNGARQIGGRDNNESAEFMLPLELGGRRAARIAVAQRELEARQFELADRERLLAAEVRLKFAESLASARKLNVVENSITVAKQGYDLVAARVTEGKTAPLEQNMLLVEYNRLRAARETAEGKVETVYFELRNMIGKRPDEPLRLRDEFVDLITTPPDVAVMTESALRDRPDLKGVGALESMATARIELAKSEGRIDASVKSGYQRMNTGFPLSGYDDHGVLKPVQDVFHFFTFGVEIDLPVRNRNQGAVEEATADLEAARRRKEFGELSIRRDVAIAIARYGRAARALSINQNGVRDTANANLSVIWQTYVLGAHDLQEYIAEQRRCLEAENDLIDAQLETYAAKVEIMKAAAAPELTKK